MNENSKQNRLQSEWIEKERHFQQKIKQLEISLRKEKEENRKNITEWNTRCTSASNALRRNQQECYKLAEQVKKSLKDKTVVLPDMELSSPISRPDSASRKRWDTTTESNKLQEEKWRHSVQTLNGKLQASLELSEKLKRVAAGVTKQLEGVVQSFQAQAVNYGVDSEDRATLVAAVPHFSSNDIETRSDDFEKHLENLFAKLKGLVGYAFSEERAQTLPTVKLLQEQVESLQSVLEAKERIIIKLTDSNFGIKQADLDLLEEKEILKEKIKLFEEKKLLVEKERKVYTEGLLRLMQERSEFEHNKALAVRQYFLLQSPCIKRNRNCSPGGDFVPPDPSNATTPSVGELSGNSFVPTPTTPEIYAELGLEIPKQRQGDSSGPTPSPSREHHPAKPDTTVKRNLFPTDASTTIPEDSSSENEQNTERKKKSSLKLVRENTVILLKEEEESEGEEPVSSPAPPLVNPEVLTRGYSDEYSNMYEYSDVQNICHSSTSLTVKTNATYYQAQAGKAPEVSILATVQDGGERVSCMSTRYFNGTDESS